MDVIGFLCVSLGSSTIQLHDSLGNRGHAHVQRLVLVVKMATVLDECSTEDHRYVVRCGQKDSMLRIFIKRCFLFTVGSVCRVKQTAATCSRWFTARGFFYPEDGGVMFLRNVG
jgi:hypothetical protein